MTTSIPIVATATTIISKITTTITQKQQQQKHQNIANIQDMIKHVIEEFKQLKTATAKPSLTTTTIKNLIDP